MEILSKRAKNLETLILLGYYPSKDINIWLKKLTKLKFLQISLLRVDLPSLDLSHLHELEMLCLSGNILVNIETLSSLKYCSKLKCLDIGYNDQLDGNALIHLKFCKALKYCNLSSWKNLNNIVDFVQTHEIQHLVINDCNDIPENVLKLLITDCNSLLELEVFGENHDKIISSALLEKSPQRSNILKLSVKESDEPLTPVNWCEVRYTDGEGCCCDTLAIHKNKHKI